MKKMLSVVFVAAILFNWSNVYAKNNMSTNVNTMASSLQSQGQYQGQSQGQSQMIKDSGNSAVVFQDSFNGSKPIRYLPTTPDVHYQGLNPSMFSRPQPDKGENFISAKTLVDLMNAWTVSEINDDDIDESEIDIDITMVGKPSSDAFVANDIVKFELKGSPEAKALRDGGSKPVAIGTIKCTEDDINSVELFLTLVKKAKEIRSTNIILLSEGVKVELESSGWGIGFSYNYASVNSDAYGQGSVGAGGTGISGGSASYKKMPYLTFAFMQ